MTPELIYCAGGNRKFAEIALRHGFTYGAQLPATVYYPPQFTDQDWNHPNFEAYMRALETHRPRIATVLDWEREDQLPEVLRWAEAAAKFVSETIIIIPKVIGGIPQLPRTIGGREVRLGYSVPTLFSATTLPAWEFAGWPVHLLGGSPQRQHALANYMNVVSIDGNYSQKQAVQCCQFFSSTKITAGANGQFPKIGKLSVSAGAWTEDVPYLAFELSCINIRNLWELGPVCTVRFAFPEDEDAIVQIASQYRNELGYVMRPALRESMARRSLFVAVHDSRVVGFVNSRRRRDGVNVIYEIAVHREVRGQKIGAALLNAIPKPKRLKVTQDNERAIAFYEQSGMTRVGAEQGKRRSLFVYEKRGA